MFYLWAGEMIICGCDGKVWQANKQTKQLYFQLDYEFWEYQRWENYVDNRMV